MRTTLWGTKICLIGYADTEIWRMRPLFERIGVSIIQEKAKYRIDAFPDKTILCVVKEEELLTDYVPSGVPIVSGQALSLVLTAMEKGELCSLDDIHSLTKPFRLLPFLGCTLSLSNYDSNDRNSLTIIIVQSGGECTDELSLKHNYLITERIVSNGEKYQFAKQNGISIVTSEWVRDSMKQCFRQHESNYVPLAEQNVEKAKENKTLSPYTYLPSKHSQSEKNWDLSLARYRIVWYGLSPSDVRHAEALGAHTQQWPEGREHASMFVIQSAFMAPQEIFEVANTLCVPVVMSGWIRACSTEHVPLPEDYMTESTQTHTMDEENSRRPITKRNRSNETNDSNSSKRRKPNPSQVDKSFFGGVVANDKTKLPFFGIKFFLFGFNSHNQNFKLEKAIFGLGGEVCDSSTLSIDFGSARVYAVTPHGVRASVDRAHLVSTQWIEAVIRRKEYISPDSVLIYRPLEHCLPLRHGSHGVLTLSLAGFTEVESDEIERMAFDFGAGIYGSINRDVSCVITKDVNNENVKLIRAKEWKIPIVREEWLIESGKRGEFLPFAGYTVNDQIINISYQNRHEISATQRMSQRKSIRGRTSLLYSASKFAKHEQEIQDSRSRSSSNINTSKPKYGLSKSEALSGSTSRERDRNNVRERERDSIDNSLFNGVISDRIAPLLDAVAKFGQELPIPKTPKTAPPLMSKKFIHRSADILFGEDENDEPDIESNASSQSQFKVTYVDQQEQKAKNHILKKIFDNVDVVDSQQSVQSMEQPEPEVNKRRCFKLASSLEPEARAKMETMITSLGGTVEGRCVPGRTTHLVCNNVQRRSASFLAALAAGMWIVTHEYVIESFKNKRFLNEDLYELCESSPSESTPLQWNSAKVWREASKIKRPFSGTMCCVLTRYENEIKTIVTAGDGFITVSYAKPTDNIVIPEETTHILFSPEFTKVLDSIAKPSAVHLLTIEQMMDCLADGVSVIE